jgi:hypothetical protein
MNPIKCLQAAMVLLLALPLHAVEHLYLELRADGVCRVGAFEGSKYARREHGAFSLSEPDTALLRQVFIRPGDTDTTRTQYFFHALWANQPYFHRNILKRLHTLRNVDRIVTVLWRAPYAAYSVNWWQAVERGEEARHVFAFLLAEQRGLKNVLCHSMGHRVFEGLAIGLEPGHTPYFDHIVFAAADLDAAVLGGSLRHLPRLCRSLHLYVNRRDRFLQASNLALGCPRLGAHGPTRLPAEGWPANLEVIDVTRSGGKIMPDPGNHQYFYNCRPVFCDLEAVLANRFEARRIEAIQGQRKRYKL